MNKRFVLLAFASVFLLSAVVGVQLLAPVAAQLRIPGVSPGDWAEYFVIYSGNGTAPSEPMDWVRLTVQTISGTNITYEQRIRLLDATEETDTFVVDVDTGQGNTSGGMFIAADLNAGDPIYTSPDPLNMFYGMTINETIFRTYLGGSVEVNHWNLTMTQTFLGLNVTTSMNYYWYRATGMIAEMSTYSVLQQVGNTTWWGIEGVIIDIIPEFPPAIILPLFMITTLLAVIGYRRKHPM